MTHHLTLPVAILAGGFATRLMPLTRDLPKSLVAVGGEPFIVHQLRLLAQQGVRRVVLLLGHRGEDVAAVVGDGSRFGLTIAAVHDGPRPLGTGGAIVQALDQLGPEFGVIYGDSYLRFDIGATVERFFAQSRPALMTVFRNAGRWGTSNVLFEEDRVRLYDKAAPVPVMQHIDYGFGLFRRSVFAGLSSGVPLDLADVYHRLSLEDRLAGLEIGTRFHEIGSFSGLSALEQALSGPDEA